MLIHISKYVTLHILYFRNRKILTIYIIIHFYTYITSFFYILILILNRFITKIIYHSFL